MEEVVIELEGEQEALAIVTNKLAQLPPPQAQPSKPSIYKVHPHLRDVNPKAYEPEIAAIGPYHHGKENLKMMEEWKLPCLESLLQRNPGVSLSEYISAVAEMEQKARSCYAESIGLTAAEFIQMLVLDGCFIVEMLMLKSRNGTSNDHQYREEWIPISLQRDLILLENQIPFFILCKLFDLIEAPNQYTRLMKLIMEFCGEVFPGSLPFEASTTKRKPEEIKHLLDLIHSNCCPPSNVQRQPVQQQPGTRDTLLIPSATKLMDHNVKFRKKQYQDEDQENASIVTLFDVDFKEGFMIMPPLMIEDRTDCFFRNIVAYEQYFPGHQPTFFTDYVRLLDCLIDSAKDVEILSQHGIIDNWLGDNEVVANIFNKLTVSVTCSTDGFFYKETFNRINAHCKKRWNRTKAVLHQVYLNSLWAYISVIAALVLLLLTAAQTVFSALQAF